jgi:hypothetical protein
MKSKRKLESIGRQTIHVQKLMSDTKHATIALTIMASSHTLLLIVIFKGAENGPIKKT